MKHLFQSPSAWVASAGLLASLFLAPVSALADDAKPAGDSFSDENPSLLETLYPEAAGSNRREILDRVVPSRSALPAGDARGRLNLRSELPAITERAEVRDEGISMVGGDPAMRAQLSHPALPSAAEFNATGFASLPPSSPPLSFYDALTLAGHPTSDDGKSEIAEPEIAEPSEPVFAVNEADKAELMETLELDARRARYVLEFREIFGPFASPEDLLQVAGITDADIVFWEGQGLLNFD